MHFTGEKTETQREINQLITWSDTGNNANELFKSELPIPSWILPH